MPTPFEPERNHGFWIASGLALFLSILSWFAPILILGLNVRLVHGGSGAAPGEWLYLVMRTVLTALLVWVIVRMPVDRTAIDAKPKVKTSIAIRPQIFDPLMALRALACFFVLMGHFFYSFFPFTDVNLPPGTDTLLRSSPWGGVWVFFTLSGFLMGKGFAATRYSLDGRGMRAFLRNRLIRIAPVYYCGLLLVVIYRYPAMLHLDNLWMLLRICLFDFDGNFPINGIVALWSVTTEMQFYLLVPALAVLLIGLRDRLGRGFLMVPAVLLVAGTCLRMFLVSRQEPFYAPLMTNLDIFIAGMSVSMVSVRKVRSQLGTKTLNVLLTVGIVVLYIGISELTQRRGQMHLSLNDFLARCPVLCVLLVGLYIYVAELRGKVALRNGITSRFLLLVQGMGTLTYCIYVFHSDVFQANADLVPKVHSLRVSLGQFPVAILETFLVASFFYFFVEKPWDTKKRVPGMALLDAP